MKSVRFILKLLHFKCPICVLLFLLILFGLNQSLSLPKVELKMAVGFVFSVQLDYSFRLKSISSDVEKRAILFPKRPAPSWVISKDL